jgi:TonB family protein
MDVTDVLRDRMREPTGLQRMVSISAMAHGLAIVALVLAPRGWLTAPVEAPRPVLTITLGGSGAGPRNGGLTAIGGRPIQQQAPPPELRTREAQRPPARATPEMTLPKPEAKRVPPPEPVKTSAAAGRPGPPTKGPEVRSGTAVAETGARGRGFGLSTGGGGGTGLTTDVADFCCPEYLQLVQQRIQAGWVQQAEVAGSVIIRFTILRDGRITQPSVERSSGYEALDLQAQTAVSRAGAVTPLPAAYPNPTLTLHSTFQYQR